MPDPLNNVIDVSHHNGNINLAAAKTDGIVGVVHKATQSTSVIDQLYQSNRRQAEAAGLLWGAYHFGTMGDGARQADFFLSTVNPDSQTLLVLDFEENKTGTMTLDQARAFVSRINEVTGRFPGLYSGSLIKQLLGNKPVDPVLSECFLWIAQYGPAPNNIPATWPTWTLWQYTDGSVGPQPHSVQGVGTCDRDKFNGSLENLQQLWGVAASSGGTSGGNES
jgi:lysozyme